MGFEISASEIASGLAPLAKTGGSGIGVLSFDIVQDLEIRISDFVIRVAPVS